MKQEHIKEQDVRLAKITALHNLGVQAYPAAAFDANTTVQKIIENYDQAPQNYQEIKIAGRLMTHRIMGNAAFCELADHTGTIQIYVKKDTLCSEQDDTLYRQVFRKLLDIGDIIAIEGNAFMTKTNTLSVNVKKLSLLAKAINPLPVVKEVKNHPEQKRYYTFSNPENRYRQRYLDLLLNPTTKKVFDIRAQIIHLLRDNLHKSGYLEVETPTLQPIYGGASARPFTTHHNKLDRQLFLRISPELYLKRLIVGGYPGVYELGKCFRNEGMSRFHNPEFTMLESYVAYKDYLWGMNYIEQLLEGIVKCIHGKTQMQVGEQIVDFSTPWKRLTLFDAIEQAVGVRIDNMNQEELYQLAQKHHITLTQPISKEKIIDEIFSTKCEPYLINPTFITDYPLAMSPLAKKNRTNPNLVERFEVICNGKEICNAYSELNDPIDQRKRLEDQQAQKNIGDQEAMMLDTDFLHAIGYGMPPTFGWGLGIDRLVMIIANVSSIQEVILFPQMRSK